MRVLEEKKNNHARQLPRYMAEEKNVGHGCACGKDAREILAVGVSVDERGIRAETHTDTPYPQPQYRRFLSESVDLYLRNVRTR
jgi:hypothetical protein